MKTRHTALFGLGGSSGKGDVTNLKREFLLTFSHTSPFLHLRLYFLYYYLHSGFKGPMYCKFHFTNVFHR